MNIAPGLHLGRYEVRAPLGVGGMGEVYVAWDHDLEREVAIKVLRYGATEPDRVHRFVQEAKAASALNHPNVAHVYEIGTHDGLRFIAMEMVGGETLRTRIARGARCRHHSSRHQARERDDPARRLRQSARLRPGEIA